MNVDIFKQVLNSPSTIRLTRDTFDLNSVMNNTAQAVFGGEGVNVLSVSLNSPMEFENEVMSVKVGMFTLPIDLQATSQGGGPQLKSMTCE